jgi:hypothetical protein
LVFTFSGYTSLNYLVFTASDYLSGHPEKTFRESWHFLQTYLAAKDIAYPVDIFMIFYHSHDHNQGLAGENP